MRSLLLTLSLITITTASASAGPKPAPGEAAARKLLVQSSPVKGVLPAKTLVAVTDPVLAKRYPKLRIFAGDHQTSFFEYPKVKSLAVIGPSGPGTAVVEMLFSDQGWTALLARFKGAAAQDLAGATALTTALRDVLGPRVWPIDFKAAEPTQVPVMQGTRLEVVLAERKPRRAVLVVSFDAGFKVTSVAIDNRTTP